MPDLTLVPFTAEVKARFWSKVDRRGEDECWPWTAGRNPRGYGKFAVQENRDLCHDTRANRVALFLTEGAPPFEDALALHSCDNPPCCNPKHLRWDTHRANCDDAVARSRTLKGVRSPHAKLTEDQAREIKCSTEGAVALATRYGVTRRVIRLIRVGEAWSHI